MQCVDLVTNFQNKSIISSGRPLTSIPHYCLWVSGDHNHIMSLRICLTSVTKFKITALLATVYIYLQIIVSISHHKTQETRSQGEFYADVENRGNLLGALPAAPGQEPTRERLWKRAWKQREGKNFKSNLKGPCPIWKIKMIDICDLNCQTLSVWNYVQTVCEFF